MNGAILSGVAAALKGMPKGMARDVIGQTNLGRQRPTPLLTARSRAQSQGGGMGSIPPAAPGKARSIEKRRRAAALQDASAEQVKS